MLSPAVLANVIDIIFEIFQYFSYEYLKYFRPISTGLILKNDCVSSQDDLVKLNATHISLCRN